MYYNHELRFVKQTNFDSGKSIWNTNFCSIVSYLDKDDKIGEVIKDQANEWYNTVVMDRIIDNNAEQCINDIVTKSQNISLKDSLDLIFNTKFVSSEPVKPVVTHELKKPTKNRQFTISIVFDGRFTQTFMEPFNTNS